MNPRVKRLITFESNLSCAAGSYCGRSSDNLVQPAQPELLVQIVEVLSKHNGYYLV